MKRKKFSHCHDLWPESLAITLFLFLACALTPYTVAGSVGDVCVKGDPMIKITSLPFKGDLKKIMTEISRDVSKGTGLPESFITYYWQTFDAIYCPGCEGVGIQSIIFVDLYTPAFMTKDERKSVMTNLALAIESHTPFSRKEVFIHTHIAEKDQLYIMGDTITNWKQVGGPDDGTTGTDKNQ